MIKLTKINGSAIVVNAELLETITATPDTIVTLSTGKKIQIRDTIDEVIQKVLAYKKEVAGKVTIARQSPEDSNKG
jgi:flagellar protein FlbD